MDFIMGLPTTRRKHDATWDIVDRLSKSAHFLAIHSKMSLENLVDLYIKEIVRLLLYLIKIFDLFPNFGKSFSMHWV